MSIKHILLASALSLGLAGPVFAAGEGSGAAGNLEGAGSPAQNSPPTGATQERQGSEGVTQPGTTGTTGTTGVAPTTPADPSGTTRSQTGTGMTDGTSPSGTMQGSAGTTGTAGVTEVPANELVGRDVVAVDGETLGEVDEVVYDAQGRVSKVTLKVGGILGIGAKTIAVERSQIQGDLRGAEDQPIRTSMTKEQLENAPAYDAEAETGVRMRTN